MKLYTRRKIHNAFWLVASVLATGFGLFWLIWLLWTLIANGLPWIRLSLFTQITPPPGSEGGLANAIVGSLWMTGVGMLIGTPLGVLAGTFLSEFGRHSRAMSVKTAAVWVVIGLLLLLSGYLFGFYLLYPAGGLLILVVLAMYFLGDALIASIVRFVNDILLSAPSIVIGVFIYTVVVVQTGHFSGWAGALALALIVVPVVLRTTEDMLRLVPDSMREAAIALGAPQWKVVVLVIYRAARTGILTGILLAVARISGETAPLLFTALNNQFWSSSLGQPLANLPVVIFQFAMSPYEGWQHLAWAGALLITGGVLLLNIIARVLQRTRVQSY